MRPLPGDESSIEALQSHRLCDTHCVSEIALRANSDGAFGVNAGPLHSIWYGHGDNVGRYDPVTRREVEYPVPSASPDVGWVTADGDDVWFSERGNGKIARIDSAGHVTEWTPPTADSAPQGIVVSHGQVWFTEYTGNAIAHLDPRTGRIQEFPVPTADSGPVGLALVPRVRAGGRFSHELRIMLHDRLLRARLSTPPRSKDRRPHADTRAASTL